jgi:hypothetical protein
LCNSPNLASVLYTTNHAKQCAINTANANTKTPTAIANTTSLRADLQKAFRYSDGAGGGEDLEAVD